MDATSLEQRARQAFAAALEEGEDEIVTLVVRPERTHDPLWPDVRATADFQLDPEGRVLIQVGGGAISDEELAEAIGGAVGQGLAERDAREAFANEDTLFEAHACFKAGLSWPAGFYRGGECLAPGAYAVDLDLFIELRVPASLFPDLRGKRLRIALDEDGIELEVPDDTDPEEVLTLPSAGLLDAEDDLAEEDVPPAAGDLHVVFVLYGA